MTITENPAFLSRWTLGLSAFRSALAQGLSLMRTTFSIHSGLERGSTTVSYRQSWAMIAGRGPNQDKTVHAPQRIRVRDFRRAPPSIMLSIG
jgi:hypothetical protein